jgi:hypothetical protein
MRSGCPRDKNQWRARKQGMPLKPTMMIMKRGGGQGAGAWMAVGVGVESGHGRGSGAAGATAGATAGGDDGIPGRGRGPETTVRALDDVAVMRTRRLSKKSKMCFLSIITKTN